MKICLNDALGFSTNFPVRSSSKRWWILRHKQVLNLSSTKRNIFINLSDFETTPTDHHPSKECHRIMADAVIKKIEETKIKKIHYESKLI